MYKSQIERIQFLIERKKYKEAQAAVSAAMVDFPEDGTVHMLQAELFLDQNQEKKALESITTAIGLEPENDYFHYIKSRTHFSKNEFKQAIEAIDAALRLDPEYAYYYGLKALILLGQEKKDLAIESAKTGLEFEAENEMCLNALSMALGSSGRVDESREVLGDMLEKDPENVFTQANVGYSYLRKGDIKKAKEHFRAALLIDPENDYVRRGMLEAIKGSNFFYRQILAYMFFMEKLSEGVRWGFLIGMILIVKVFPPLLPFYLVLIFWVWFAPPIADVVLYIDKNGRFLMEKENRILTRVNMGLLSFSIISLGLAAYFSPTFLGVAFASFVAIVPVYHIYLREKVQNKLAMGGFASIFFGIGLAGLFFGGLQAESFPFWTVLIIAVVAFTWLANLFKG